MKILVDTCVWSLALRQQGPQNSAFVKELMELLEEVRVEIIGPIRQELLSRIKSKEQFEKLQMHLAEFHDLPLETADFEKAAEFHNINQKKGVQGSNTDFLICSVAYRREMEIFTFDRDFSLFSNSIPIKLYVPR
jgi:predicted nucleic acid-binding protein